MLNAITIPKIALMQLFVLALLLGEGLFYHDTIVYSSNLSDLILCERTMNGTNFVSFGIGAFGIVKSFFYIKRNGTPPALEIIAMLSIGFVSLLNYGFIILQGIAPD